MTYIVGIFSFLITLYALGNYILYTLPIAEAGPIFGISHTGLRRISQRLSSVYKKRIEGHICRYRRFVIQGICMAKIGLNPEDIICVRMFENDADKLKIQSGDAVLIFLNDNDFRGYKIRIIKELKGNKAETFYYDANGNEKFSSAAHTLQSIIGVVDLQESGVNKMVA